MKVLLGILLLLNSVYVITEDTVVEYNYQVEDRVYFIQEELLGCLGTIYIIYTFKDTKYYKVGLWCHHKIPAGPYVSDFTQDYFIPYEWILKDRIENEDLEIN